MGSFTTVALTYTPQSGAVLIASSTVSAAREVNISGLFLTTAAATTRRVCSGGFFDNHNFCTAFGTAVISGLCDIEILGCSTTVDPGQCGFVGDGNCSPIFIKQFHVGCINSSTSSCDLHSFNDSQYEAKNSMFCATFLSRGAVRTVSLFSVCLFHLDILFQHSRFFFRLSNRDSTTVHHTLPPSFFDLGRSDPQAKECFGVYRVWTACFLSVPP